MKRVRVREIASRIVREVEDGEAARTKLDKVTGLDARDRALLTELVYGTVRHRATLEHLLSGVSSRGLEDTDPEVLAALLVGAYQLVFLDHVAAGVAVSEAVESVRQRHLKGFVNGVLRGVGRLVQRREPADDAPEPSTRRLPGREKGWVVLADDVLPDAARAPAEWLALATAHPPGLVGRWLERFGFEKTLEVCRAGNAPPPLCVRTNTLRTTREGLVDELATEGARKGTVAPEAVYLDHKGDPSRLAAFREGRFLVQDETAMLVAPLTGARPGSRVLDLCSAPGGKATHLAELMKDQGHILATDADPTRLGRVRENVERLGLRSVVVGAIKEDAFDAVLVDVPCSNTGVLRRRVEVRTRVDDLDRLSLVALQRDLLEKALAHRRPGGVLVYSTCSIEKEENEDQVAWLLERHPDLERRAEIFTLPGRDAGDGGYAVSIVSRTDNSGLSSARG